MVQREGHKTVERAPKILVIDASVAAKWFIPEYDSAKAIAIRDKLVDGKLNLLAPDLLAYEVANTLRFHPEITEKQIEQDVEDLMALDIDLVTPSSELVTTAVNMARDLEMTVYDASYLAVAQDIPTSLVTADRMLYAKAERTGSVLLLENSEKTWMLL